MYERKNTHRTPCHACPLRRKELFDRLTRDELAFMETFKIGEMEVEAGTPILEQGSSTPQLFTVLRGMGLRYTLLQSGQRQVVNFAFPGDFIGLQAGLTRESGHSLVAVTPMTLCVFSRAELWRLFRQQPSRAYALTWLAAVEEHFLGETIATLGQRDAMQRIAWAFVRIYQRLRAIDLGREGAVPFPYRQQDLADALGLSLVHTNKTLKALRDRQLASWRNDTLQVMALAALAEIAMVDLQEIQERPLI